MCKAFQLLALALVLDLFAPPPVGADEHHSILTRLIDRSEAIAIGVVRQVTDSPDRSGRHTASIEIQETLEGALPSEIALAGDRDDGSAPYFAVDTQLLLFLERADTPNTAGGWTPVDRQAGTIVLADEGAREQARKIMGRALRGDYLLSAYTDVLQRSDLRVPRPLLGSLLDALEVGDEDTRLLVDAACDSAGTFLPAVQGWAIGQAGSRKIGDARECLEALALSPKAAEFAVPAVEALGDIGDPRSLPFVIKQLDAGLGAKQEDGRPRMGTTAAAAAILALGKIRDPKAINDLVRIAREHTALAIGSTVVHALGLIGGPQVRGPLTAIMRTHPNLNVQKQARETLAQLPKGKGR